MSETFYFLILCYQFFSFVNFFNFTNFYSTKSKLFFYFYIFWNLIYILFWKFAACSFPIFDWSKTPVLLYFEKKSYTINQKSRALSYFLEKLDQKHLLKLIPKSVSEFLKISKIWKWEKFSWNYAFYFFSVWLFIWQNRTPDDKIRNTPWF